MSSRLLSLFLIVCLVPHSSEVVGQWPRKKLSGLISEHVWAKQCYQSVTPLLSYFRCWSFLVTFELRNISATDTPLSRASRGRWTRVIIRRAELELAQAEAGGQDSGALTALRTQVRAGAMSQFFKEDPKANRLEAALILNMPIQRYLNSAFSAEADTSSLVESLSAIPSSAQVTPEDALILQAQSLRRNLDIISGTGGEQILVDIANLLSDYTSGPWAELSLGADDLYKVSSALVKGLGDIWHRLVFKFDQPKFNIFKACSGPSPDASLIDSVVDPILQSHERCDGCVDTSFTLPWAKRLKHARRHVVSKAHRSLRDVLSALPVSSAKCERKHVIGQDLRRFSKRGRTLTCKSLSKMTYCKSVSRAASVLQRRVVQESVGSKAGYRQMMQGAASFRVGRSKRRDVNKEGGPPRKFAKFVKVRAYDVFLARSLGERANPDVRCDEGKRRPYLATGYYSATEGLLRRCGGG